MRVKATREGLVGNKTASGYIIDVIVPFVALPSTEALFKFVKILNPLNGKVCAAIVLDVGPWNEHDDNYVFRGARPFSETGWHVIHQDGKSSYVSDPRKVNGAGIDLSDRVWKTLGMLDNTDVDWEFIII